jgi:hypothetical protein
LIGQFQTGILYLEADTSVSTCIYRYIRIQKTDSIIWSLTFILFTCTYLIHSLTPRPHPNLAHKTMQTVWVLSCRVQCHTVKRVGKKTWRKSGSIPCWELRQYNVPYMRLLALYTKSVILTQCDMFVNQQLFPTMPGFCCSVPSYWLKTETKETFQFKKQMWSVCMHMLYQ